MVRINVSSSPSVTFRFGQTDSPAMAVELGRPVYTGGEPYEGPYDVTPKVTAQTLPTAKKLMREDVSVRAIPYFDVSNPAGGNTIYIANEV